MTLFCPFCSKEITPDEIQCLACGTMYRFETLLRIRKLAEKATQEEYPDERRRSDRIPQKFIITYTTPKAFKKTFLSNISTGGIFVKTNDPLSLGETITLKIFLPDGGKEFEASGEVVWSRKEERVTPKGKLLPGMGIKFLNLAVKDIIRIIKVVSKSAN